MWQQMPSFEFEIIASRTVLYNKLSWVLQYGVGKSSLHTVQHCILDIATLSLGIWTRQSDKVTPGKVDQKWILQVKQGCVNNLEIEQSSVSNLEVKHDCLVDNSMKMQRRVAACQARLEQEDALTVNTTKKPNDTKKLWRDSYAT